MNSILVAVPGVEIDRKGDRLQLSEGYEIWNLRRMSFEVFKKQVLRNPIFSEHLTEEKFVLAPSDYERASWGLLLPVGPFGYGMYSPTKLLIDLYSPQFLFPVFYLMGATAVRLPPVPGGDVHKDISILFGKPEFPQWHQALVSESGYAWPENRRAQHWTPQDWRMCIGCLLFGQLSDYATGKQIIGWQREAADLSCILEALLNAENEEKSEITYRLRKRASVVLGNHDPSADRELKRLYDQRSSFVHGTFFKHYLKESKKKSVDNYLLPSPPFDDLSQWKNLVRKILVACLYINKIRATEAAFAPYDGVPSILEAAILDIELRQHVRRRADEILSLTP